MAVAKKDNQEIIDNELHSRAVKEYNFDMQLHAEVRKVTLESGTIPAEQTNDGKPFEWAHLIVAVDTDDLDRVYLQDDNEANEKLYKRGQVGTFTLNLTGIPKCTKVRIRRFVVDN